jgi:hypothetical protein
LIGTATLAWLSRKSLRSPGQHGFYRFFAWEAILGLIVLNQKVWGTDPFSPHQITSWLLMLLSIFLVIQAYRLMTKHGQASLARDDGTLYQFEKTTQLVTTGIFGYIRHPMYTSLLALAWGAYFQNPNCWVPQLRLLPRSACCSRRRLMSRNAWPTSGRRTLPTCSAPGVSFPICFNRVSHSGGSFVPINS